VAGGSYRDLLNADQFQRAGIALLYFKAEGDRLAHALHQRVETFCLRMASTKGGDSGDEVALFVLFDQDGECSLGLHAHALADLLYHNPRRCCGALRNRAGSFSVERLMDFLTALGQDVEISVKPARGRQGAVSLVG